MSDDALFQQVKARIPRNESPEERVQLGLILAGWTLDGIMAQNWVRFEQSLHDNHCSEDNIVDMLIWAHQHMQDQRAEALEKLRLLLVTEFCPVTVTTLNAGIDGNSGSVH